MKHNLQQIGFIILGVIFVLGGFQVIFNGSLESTSASSSIYQFNGVERLMGLLPIIFGSLVAYLSFKKLKR